MNGRNKKQHLLQVLLPPPVSESQPFIQSRRKEKRMKRPFLPLAGAAAYSMQMRPCLSSASRSHLMSRKSEK